MNSSPRERPIPAARATTAASGVRNVTENVLNGLQPRPGSTHPPTSVKLSRRPIPRSLDRVNDHLCPEEPPSPEPLQ